jgi:nicotinamide mononucleotide (NMN) deamidase PncC
MHQQLKSDKVARIGELLKARGETVAVAESSTGGLIAASLLSVSGASAYFLHRWSHRRFAALRLGRVCLLPRQ